MKTFDLTTPVLYDEKWQDWVDMKIYGPASRWLRSLIRDQLTNVDKKSVMTLLDVGCGEGTLTYDIAKNLPLTRITAIDFSKTGIACADAAYKLPNLEFMCDPDSIRLNGSYDMVTAFEVLEHVKDWKELLGRMAKASNSYLLLSFPTGRMRPFEVNVGHFRNFKKGEVEDFLAGCSFRPASLFYAGFPFYSPLYREFCNLTNSASNPLTTGKFAWHQKALGWVGYFFFRFLSTKKRRGDQFCGLFVRA
jgi:SAM-dependent methyltransferase